MTTNQRIKLTMFLAVRTMSDKFREVTKKIIKFDAAFATFIGLVDEIQSASEQQRMNKTGITSDKKRMRKKVIDNIIKYSNKLIYLAKSIKNDTLLKEVKINESNLATMSAVALHDSAKIIYAKLEANLVAMEEYGVTPDTQKQFGELISAFNQAITSPRVGIVERSNATKKLSLLYDQADEALGMLDNIVESAREEQPDFYRAYRDARKIVNDNSGKIALRGGAIDIISKEPIKGVFFRFRPKELKTGSLQEITKKTANKGRFNVKSLFPGSYQVLVSKDGYREKNTSLVINEGESKEIIVEMERE